jgi:hypothetical protein
VEEEIYVRHEPSNAERHGGPALPEHPRTTRGWYLLLVVPLIGTLIPPIYNTKDPTLIGIPFFYWYLMAWVLITVAVMALAERTIEDDR